VAHEDVLVRIGSYTGGSRAGRGIVAARVKPDGSRIEQVGVTRAEDPSYLATAPSGKCLYAVGETKTGTLAAFRSTADILEPLNVVSSGGAEPCHLALACGGRFLVAANYSSGSVAVCRLRADGGIGEQTCVIRHRGHGPDTERQEGPHTHMISPVPWDDGLLFVTDLGADAVYAYRLDPHAGDLTLAGRTAMPPGSGPRHFAFHSAEPLAYVLCELDCTLLTCAWDRATGKLTTLACNNAAPRIRPASATCSAIRVSPDSRFLYAACRGTDTITVFGLTNPAAPEQANVMTSGGKTPRDIALAAEGRLLLSANQESDTVTVFRVDPRTGTPTRTGVTLTTPSPTCIQAD
jgi:6-phosphogluconolactonase